MTTAALPDIQRSSPVTVTADTPVLNILKPVTETAFSDALRNPVDGIVVADQILFYSSCLLYTSSLPLSYIITPVFKQTVPRIMSLETDGAAMTLAFKTKT